MARNNDTLKGGLKVLYIEDEKSQRELLSQSLKKRGHIVYSKESGESGLQFLEKDSADIVLCDLNMPGMGGMEVLQALRQKGIKSPFMLITAHGSVELARQAIREGVYHFLMKPFDIDNIEILMYQAVEHRILQQSHSDNSRKLEKATIELAQANVDLLGTREKIEQKNKELDSLLDELTKNQEELHAILDSSPSAILMTNRFGKVGSANARVSEFFGINSKEVIGQQFQEFGQKIKDCFANQNKYMQLLQSLWTNPDSESVELSIGEHTFANALKIARPHERYVTFSTLPVKGQEDIDLGRMWIFDDVTLLKKADEQLHTIIEASPVPLIISKVADGTIIYVNDVLANLVGHTAKELIGMKTPAFYADPKVRDVIIQKLNTQKMVPSQELEIKRRDGSTFWTITSLSLTELGGEKVVVGGFYDITDRREAESALRVSEERFRGFVENANDIVFSMDPRGIFKYLSPRFTDFLGWKTDEYIGKNMLEILHPDDRVLTEKWITSGFQDTGWRTRDGFRLKQKSGEWRWFTSDASVIRGEDGSPLEVIGIAHDITEIRNLVTDLENANKVLKDTQAQLAQSDKMAALGMLVAGIAHEINTPVGAISSMHDSLSRGIKKLKVEVTNRCQNEEDKKRFDNLINIVDEANRVIYTGAERVGTIVKRLRRFARLDEAELKTVDIHEGIEDTLTLAHHELKHDIEVIKDYGKFDPIPCYPGQLNQVFLNLIVNARQAIKGKGTVTIKTHSDGKNVLIEISDSGVGIPKENVARIFDPGFTTKGVGVGTGLGLSICYQIIKSHKGDITVRSEPGKGSTFTIMIPTNLDKLIEKS